MDLEGWKRLEGLIDEALELDPADRAAFVDRVRAQDPERGRELQAFLASEAAADGFLGASVEEEARALIQSLGAEGPLDEELPEGTRRIGPYRLLSELGRGGMGAVFLAERADGQFEQRVALKLVKPGMDTAEILERFRAERQILARLQHPHIARLLDGGAAEGGQPYFALEHVAGTPLTLYCDRARLSIGDRLRLFLQVCDAVEYAHRNLVVHRDLKPSNVLVTEEGVAKLLDFGIAKVLDASGEGLATVTRAEARPLTPLYAAPEQLLGDPVTTATDVYSLGLILHELVSGRRPLAATGFDRATVERVMRDRERERPSSAVRRADGEKAATGTTADEIAAARGLSVERLVRHLAGDIDNVVGKALRREPERRYASAGALAEDVRRFLVGRPVTARADTLTYRASKFVKRHRWGVAAACVLGVSLAAGVVGTVWQAREAVRQARKAEEVKKFVFSLFGQADPNNSKGKDITARQLLEQGAQRIPAELAGQPEVEAEMLMFVGAVYYRLGLANEGKPLFEQALALRRGLFGDDSLGVADTQLWLGNVAVWQGQLEPARQLLEEVLRKRTKRLGPDHTDTAFARALLGRVYLEKRDLARAEPLLRAALADERRRLKPPHEELASNINALGRVLHLQGDYVGAERLYGEALAMRLQLYGEENTHVSESEVNVAAVRQDRGDPRGAEPLYRRALALDRRLLGDTHEKVANDLNNLGYGLVTTGDYAEAEERLREALQIRQALWGVDSPRTAIALHALARALRQGGKLDEAEADSRRALALAVPQLGDDHVNVAAVREGLARTLCAAGKHDEAEALARRALGAYRQELAADHASVADGLVTLAHVLVAAGKPAEAEGLLEEALRVRRGRFGDDDWRTAEARLELGGCLTALGRGTEAATHLAAARAALVERLGPQHPLAREADRSARADDTPDR